VVMASSSNFSMCMWDVVWRVFEEVHTKVCLLPSTLYVYVGSCMLLM
jgi:hypothetical protein